MIGCRHPDKNPAPEAKVKFAEISEAVNVLTNKDTRAIYDQYGEAALKNNGGGAHHRSASSIFEEFFGGGAGVGIGGMGGNGSFFSPFGFSTHPEKRRTPNLQFPLAASLADFYNGRMRKLKVNRSILCPKCTGTGAKDAASVKTCDRCNGRKHERIRRALGPGMVQEMLIECTICQGKGSMIVTKCVECEGGGLVPQSKILHVCIEPGMAPGRKFVFHGEANEAKDHETGNIIVLLVPLSKKKTDPTTTDEEEEVHDEENEKPSFNRKGHHLFLDKTITLLDALMGFEFTVEHLDKRLLLIQSPVKQVLSAGHVLVVEGEGMPVWAEAGKKGNLLIHLTIQMPVFEAIQEHRSTLEKLFAVGGASVKRQDKKETVISRPSRLLDGAKDHEYYKDQGTGNDNDDEGEDDGTDNNQEGSQQHPHQPHPQCRQM